MVDTSEQGYHPHGAIISTDMDTRTAILIQRFKAMQAEKNRGLSSTPSEELLDERHVTIGVGHNFQGKMG